MSISQQTVNVTFIQFILNENGDPIYNEDNFNEVLCEILVPSKYK